MEQPPESGPPTGIVLSRFQEDHEMAGKRDKPEEIVLQVQRKSVQEAVRQIGVTVQTY